MAPIKSLDLFTGAGGFVLGLEDFAVPVAYCEIDKRAVEVLKRRMSDGSIPTAPILGDIRDVSGRSALGGQKVELITAGFPCPDVSSAGPRVGIEGGNRTVLVYEALRLVKELKPSYVFFENVSNLAGDPAFVKILKSLSGMGYDWAFDFFSAAMEGGKHIRDRWLLLAQRRSPPPVPVRPRCHPRLRAALRLKRGGTVACDIRDEKCRDGQKFMKLYGNAVVPSVACTAFKELYEQLNSPDDDEDKEVVSLNDPGVQWARTAAISRGGVTVQVSPRRDKGTCSGATITVYPRSNIGRLTHNTQPVVTKVHQRSCLPTPRTITSASVLTQRTKNDLGPVVLASHLASPKHRKSKSARVDISFLENLMGFPRGWSAP